jgi:NADP-reducing hydrogenase subunit HndB
MGKVNTPDELKKLRDRLQIAGTLHDESEKACNTIRVKVAMATCSIASGSRETINYLSDELEKRNIDAIVSQTGCMGYCYAEPTIEISIPGKEPVVFGYVDEKKADEIIEKYIKGGELIEGIIPVNYRSIDDNTI